MNKNYKPFLSALLLTLASTASLGQALPVGGAAENTPSHSEYFSWTSFPQLFYPLMTRQFFCDFHEKSEDFCVS